MEATCLSIVSIEAHGSTVWWFFSQWPAPLAPRTPAACYCARGLGKHDEKNARDSAIDCDGLCTLHVIRLSDLACILAMSKAEIRPREAKGTTNSTNYRASDDCHLQHFQLSCRHVLASVVNRACKPLVVLWNLWAEHSLAKDSGNFKCLSQC